jgi:glycosyltransferase involved in cell wall biosynthesis
MKRVLYVLHNHPTLRPGGAEAYALELYQAMRSAPGIDPILVARSGRGGDADPPQHPGAPFSVVGNDRNEYFLYTYTDGVDFFYETYRDKSLYTVYIADFLRTFRPDVVHFQHTHFIGYDMVTLVRRMLPDVPIVYTLHEYLPICHRDGQLVRTRREALCLEASPRRCNECFPDWSAQHFFLRERLIKSHLSHVDMFLAPSNFLLERYVDWGIARDRLRFEDYGRIPQAPVRTVESRPRTRLAFFGQISPYKGVEVLLDAMAILQREGSNAHLVLHGANIDVLPPADKERIVVAISAVGGNVTVAGPYEPASVPHLMSGIDWVVVPSRWWENSPLVIQEAFMHGRPVICSGIGGMAEKVRNRVNGLHFNTSNAADLAATIREATGTPGLWEELRAGIPRIYSMDDHVATLTSLYEELAERRRDPRSAVPAGATG